MDKKIQRAFEIYKSLLLDVHIPTKTKDKNLHEDSQEAYEFAFRVVHDVLEARQDSGVDKAVSCEEAGQNAYELVEELKGIVLELVKSNKDVAIDNLLRGLAQEANSVCGNMRRYSEENEKEDEDEKEDEESPAFGSVQEEPEEGSDEQYSETISMDKLRKNYR